MEISCICFMSLFYFISISSILRCSSRLIVCVSGSLETCSDGYERLESLPS